MFKVLRGLSGLCHVVMAERVFVILFFGFLLQGFHEIGVVNERIFAGLVLECFFETKPQSVIFGERLLGLNKSSEVEFSFCIEVGDKRVKLLLNGRRVGEKAFLFVIKNLGELGL